MIRVILASLLIIHGAIHLVGFSTEFKLLPAKSITSYTRVTPGVFPPKAVGSLWLLSAIVFVVAATLFLLKKDGWWMMGLTGLLLSQLLIIVFWSDAKYGTIINLLLLVPIMAAYGSWQFNRSVQSELQTFIPSTAPGHQILTAVMTRDLPVIVQKWLKRSNSIGNLVPQTAYIRQRGKMRTKPRGQWMPVNSEEFFTVENPGFYWKATVQATPFVTLAARDKYQQGEGNMQVKLLSLLSIADKKGEKIDQGSLIRYLAEICWLPSAAVSIYITWETVDDLTAKAIIQYGNIKGAGLFTFTADGDIRSFEAQRYYDRKEGATLETWLVNHDPTSYRDFEGIRIPSKSAITWRLKTGDFNWFNMEILDATYKTAEKNIFANNKK